jgi:protein TonB
MALPYRGLAGSLALHAAVVAALFFQWPRAAEPTSIPAPQAVAVSFAAQAAVPNPAPQPLEALDEVEPAEQVEAIELVDEVENLTPEEVATVEPEPEVAPQPAPLADAPAAPPEVATVPPPEPVTATAPEPPVQKAPAAKKPKPAPAPAAAPAPLPEAVAQQSASISPASRDLTYPDMLLAWLQKKLIYPPKAERRGLEGTATVWLSIDATGHVLGYRIVKSTGHRLLDDEVEALIERADPMPPVPEGEQQATLEFLIPVDFNIR